MRRLGAPVIIALFAIACAEPAAGRQAAGACFWLHGRLFAANGNPTFRIWRIGTRRGLGVNLGAHASAAIGDLPGSVRALIPGGDVQVDIYGDYQVCPLTRGRQGWMRFVRIVQARRLIARPEAWRRRSG